MTVFLMIGAIGVALALIALLVGDVLDGFLDGILNLDALDNDLFSISSVSAFVGAFGFGGALGLSLVDNMAVAVASGLVIGALAAWGAVALTRRLKHDQRHTFRSDSLVGHPARVITAIPEVGYGEIRLIASGHVRKFSARAERPIEAGTDVWVSAVVSPTAVEVRLANEPQQLN
ncbi:MAG: hypothetical protein Q4F65_13280 [Propionibacteriaceae bacterium]|nr:hypothetical protein [Propionibacteriaceae bacterium]